MSTSVDHGAQSVQWTGKKHLSELSNQCTVSGNRKTTAEWKVDLGKVYQIHHIFIQYRTDNLEWSKISKNKHLLK